LNDQVNGALSELAKRREVEFRVCTKHAQTPRSLHIKQTQLADVAQDPKALLALLFETEQLRSVTRRYGIF
jgi:hypothetical protein